MNRRKAEELRAQGWSYQKIGKALGVSNQRVHQVLTGWKPKTARAKERLRQHSRRWRQAHPEWNREQNHKNVEYRKLQVITHYGDGEPQCVKCGFSDIRALTIDHIQACGTQNRTLRGQLLYQYLIRNHYPKGFQTLCMNCQWIKRHENREFGGHILPPQSLIVPDPPPQLSLKFP